MILETMSMFREAFFRYKHIIALLNSSKSKICWYSRYEIFDPKKLGMLNIEFD